MGYSLMAWSVWPLWHDVSTVGRRRRGWLTPTLLSRAIGLRVALLIVLVMLSTYCRTGRTGRFAATVSSGAISATPRCTPLLAGALRRSCSCTASLCAVPLRIRRRARSVAGEQSFRDAGADSGGSGGPPRVLVPPPRAYCARALGRCTRCTIHPPPDTLKGPRHHLCYFWGRGLIVWRRWCLSVCPLTRRLACSSRSFWLERQLTPTSPFVSRPSFTPSLSRPNSIAFTTRSMQAGNSNYSTVFPMWDMIFDTHTIRWWLGAEVGIDHDPLPRTSSVSSVTITFYRLVQNRPRTI